MDTFQFELFRAAFEDLERENRELRAKVKRRDIVIDAFKREHKELRFYRSSYRAQLRQDIRDAWDNLGASPN